MEKEKIMTRNKKIIITLFIIALLLIGAWLSLDSRTKNSLYRATLCKLIYGKNICNFYEMMDTVSSDPENSDFEKAMQLCREMEDVPKKDSCFEYIAQVVSFYDTGKAKEACGEIKGFGGIHNKEGCYSMIEKSMVGNIILYENSKWGAIYEKSEEGMEIASLLIRKLRELNLQARCIISEEDLQGMKEKNKIVELVFKKSVDITISQWVEPEERPHIPVDEKGYRVLEDVGTTLFILEDNLDEGLEAHILIGHGTEREGYGCWAIKQEDSNELDKTWIDKINKLLLNGA